MSYDVTCDMATTLFPSMNDVWRLIKKANGSRTGAVHSSAMTCGPHTMRSWT